AARAQHSRTAACHDLGRVRRASRRPAGEPELDGRGFPLGDGAHLRGGGRCVRGQGGLDARRRLRPRRAGREHGGAPGRAGRPRSGMGEPMSDTAEKPIEEMSFEEALKALEGVVEALEGGQVPLVRSLDLYERGEMLRKHCEDRLKAAELRVEKIVSGGNGEASGTTP